LVDYVFYPYPGYFDWIGLMRAREAAAQRIGADWVVFVSADEIMHSYRETETLAEAVERVALTGANVIDFNEFVFLPIERDYLPDTPGNQPLRYYYFFEPKRPRLMRARECRLAVSHVEQGGHVLTGAAFKLADEQFALRHYIFRDQESALRKYRERVFAPEELARGWHGNRHNKAVSGFVFPPAGRLERLDRLDERKLRKAHPHKQHYWEWSE
jgi:hypothetical protein